MNINRIGTNFSFKGYKNLISYSQVNDSGYGFSYMAMKLNNEGATNDLDTWHLIQKNLFKRDTLSDYLFFVINSSENGDIMILDEHLLDIEKVRTRSAERMMLKAYTLLSSLTKRIICTDHQPQDKDIYLTLVDLIKKLTNIVQNKELVEQMSMVGANKVVKHYKTAEVINNTISKRMVNYFKL